MSQAVQLVQFSADDFKTDAGVKRLNNWIRQVTTQIWMMQGNTGNIKPDSDIDLQGKYQIVNPKA